MKSFAALIGRISSIIIMACGGVAFAFWIIAAIISFVIFMAAAVVCAVPLAIGVLIQNWADRLNGKAVSFNSFNLTGLMDFLARYK